MSQPSLFDLIGEPPVPEDRPPDQPARDFAVDPRNDVVLEASAGTGKTRVLVDRYVRLLASGVDPRHILAMTFTRKAATEMRDRVLSTLRKEADSGRFSRDAWATLSARMHDVQISTIDGFCFGLLREFPLEADVDPTFEVADETEIARFAGEALDRALRAARALVETDEHIRLLFVRVKQPVLREGVAALIDRRQVALPAIATFVAQHGGPVTGEEAAARFIARLRAELPPAVCAALVEDGPGLSAEFRWLAADLANLDAVPAGNPARVQHLRRRLEAYFLTRSGEPRKRLASQYRPEHFRSVDAKRRHEAAVKAVAPRLSHIFTALDADLDGLLARGLLRLLSIAASIYERLLGEHALLDFAGMLDRAVRLLEQQEEFSRSRLKLQSRYHHLLVDEFQDTSRQQWRLVELLIDAWAEGEGAADAQTSIFVVGDRKQSIYRFRHAEVTLLDEAARRIGALRPGRDVRQAISTSFRSVPELLAFVNALSMGMAGDVDMADRWQYRDTDRFPTPVVDEGARRDGVPVLGLVAQPTIERSAAAVADEIVRLLDTAQVRDRETGPRRAKPDDIVILFRARAGHQYFEDALERRGVQTYVYKGLGFFDAPEVQDLQALLRFLARPESDLRAAEFLRSRFVRLSDQALAELAATGLSRGLVEEGTAVPASFTAVDAGLLRRARVDVARWLALSQRVPPGELLDVILREAAYVFELRGRRLGQARENLKKVRALVRRVENRGYATIDRLASYFETLRAGDDSNAIVEAAGAVNLMTIHAAKGLEFPIVFVVNLHAAGRGRAGGFSVIEQGPTGAPEVTFGSTPATALEDRRELEELRRLMYVATTRARDRLYLAAEVDRNGGVKRGPRSLAGLLPASLATCFVDAYAAVEPEVVWTTEQGSFAFAVCRPREEPVSIDIPPAPAGETDILAVAPVLPSGLVTRAASTVWTAGDSISSDRMGHPGPRRDDEADSRIVGTLVHRLLQRAVDRAQDDETLAAAAIRLLTVSERVDADDPSRAASAAIRLYRSVLEDPEVSGLLASGEVYYEVPFSYCPPDEPGVCLRGAVDCLVAAPDGATLTILEFKTGQPRPEHRVQLDLYIRAISAALTGKTVTGRVCYPKTGRS
jgi:ATP-dependent helicase/nuclease subunit A